MIEYYLCLNNKKRCIVCRRASTCRNPGLNQGPLDLQSNALPTELFRPTKALHPTFYIPRIFHFCAMILAPLCNIFFRNAKKTKCL